MLFIQGTIITMENQRGIHNRRLQDNVLDRCYQNSRYNKMEIGMGEKNDDLKIRF